MSNRSDHLGYWCRPRDSNPKPRTNLVLIPGINRLLCQLSYDGNDGGGCGIRTHGGLSTLDSFQDCCDKPGSANPPCLRTFAISTPSGLLLIATQTSRARLGRYNLHTFSEGHYSLIYFLCPFSSGSPLPELGAEGRIRTDESFRFRITSAVHSATMRLQHKKVMLVILLLSSYSDSAHTTHL